ADTACTGSANRAEASVDRAYEVPRDERLPTFVLSDPVCPLLVDEESRRTERHHENHGLRPAQRRQLVFDDPEPDGHQEGPRPARRAVQEVEDGVAVAGMRGVPGWQVDVDRLPA